MVVRPLRSGFGVRQVPTLSAYPMTTQAYLTPREQHYILLPQTITTLLLIA
jgi:hypothetical protein